MLNLLMKRELAQVKVFIAAFEAGTIDRKTFYRTAKRFRAEQHEIALALFEFLSKTPLSPGLDENDPSNGAPAVAASQIVKTYKMHGNYVNALSAARANATRLADNPVAQTQLVTALLDNGERDEALAAARANATRFANDPVTQTQLVTALLDNGERDEALAAARANATRFANDPVTQTQLVTALLDNGERDEALAAARANATRFANDPVTQTQLVTALLDNGERDEALAAARANATRFANDPVTQTQLVTALLDNGERDEALAAARANATRFANDPVTQTQLVTALLDNGQREEALQICKGQIKNNQANCYTYGILTGIYLKQRQMLSADKVLNAGLQAYPHNQFLRDLQYRIGNALVDQSVSQQPEILDNLANELCNLGLVRGYHMSTIWNNQLTVNQPINGNAANVAYNRGAATETGKPYIFEMGGQ